ncbi:MAG: translation initiation factor IF-2 [Bacteroidota bacterium]|nr:translation initiation factor IF-2 [Candidatus Kapabacteria bacterium]MDW8219470.1 translation initiation factor IF-2 [Bacteroidota bacterium]
MASIGTKLFKIASQINVGKETIVEFLQAKGFSIENKATSTLTDDMVELVLKNFQKEAAAASKYRARTSGEKDHASHSHEEHAQRSGTQQTTFHHDQVEHTHSPDNSNELRLATEAHTASSDSASTLHTPLAQPQGATESDIPVGTVIQLDEPVSRKKPKRSKTVPSEKSSQVQTTQRPHDTLSSEPEHSTFIYQTEAASKEITASLHKQRSAEEPHEEHVLSPEHLDTSIELVSPSSEEFIPQPIREAAEHVLMEEHEVMRESDELTADDDESIDALAHDDKANKRKRKKRIGEVEYFVDNTPYTIPSGLTILGKIDLGSTRREASSRRSERRSKESHRDDSKEEQLVRIKGASSKMKDWIKEDAPIPAKKSLGGSSKKKRKKSKREQVSAEEVEKAIRRTLAGQEESQLAMRSRLRQRRKQERADELERQAELRELESTILRVTEFITVAELADLIGVPTNEIILKCMGLGLMVSINQRLEKDTITLIASDYGLEVEFEDAFAEEALEEDDDEDESLLEPRAPIVTVMGHVDHGKTSLLDYIRKTSVASVESGGITQHIGAYSVKTGLDGKCITFLDTPGHQAFTAMRARGAQLTDIVVLVVAADDNVMPQTVEAISHARAANVPIIVAINKIDKPEANPDRIRQQLAEHNVLVEEWGGKVQSALISAKKGTNVDQLLEKILLEAEILNLRANPHRKARGTVVESKIDKGKGAVATVIVQKGTLHVGDPFLCGIHAGRVRAMFNENGERMEKAIPSTPVQILGFDGVPQAGDSFIVMDSEVQAREIASARQQIKREQDFKRIRHVTLDDIASRIKAGAQELKIILKGDTDGSVEALSDALQKLSTEEVKVSIILRAVGPISESDVMLAAASDAVIIGFHVRPTAQVLKLAESEGVDIRLYRIIYDCISEVKLALEGMLTPEIKEEVVGVAEIREIFKISKVGNIAGCYVLEGKINRNDSVRLLRDGFEIFTGKLASLRRLKDDVREVDAGFECGMAIEGYNDIRVGDLIEAVRKTEVKRKL